MNFDFLKDTRELGYVYENCSNAEKLAMTMPVQSIFTSRKSAELLAKLIYMAAHNRQMEELSFAEILADRTVRDFIRSRDIMDAFHFIRKNGNRAVHEDTQWNVDDALDVLQDLHYITGETACMLGLIQDYPQFDEAIDVFPDAQYDEDERITEKAQEMFCAYLEEYNAQMERDQYIEMQDYDWPTYCIEGNVVMHEYLEFKSAPKQIELVEYLQVYLRTLLDFSITRSAEKAKELGLDYPVTFIAKLTIDGVNYLSSNVEAFITAITEKLPKAKTFVLDCTCDGVLREYFNDELDDKGNGRLNMIRKDAVWSGAGMLDKMEYYKRRERFAYKLAIFYPDSGEYRYEKILNGRTIDVEALMMSDFPKKIPSKEWFAESLVLVVGFDFDEHPDILEKLRSIVRKYISQDQLAFCEDSWEDEEQDILLNHISWSTCDFKDVQRFLDEINEALASIIDTVDADADGYWEIPSEFALAKCQWNGTKFELVGVLY